MEDISRETSIGKAELAYRWVIHNSALRGKLGDKIVFAARNVKQLKQTLEFPEKGPLDEEIVDKIEQVWGVVEEEAPRDVFNDVVAQMMDSRLSDLWVIQNGAA